MHAFRFHFARALVLVLLAALGLPACHPQAPPHSASTSAPLAEGEPAAPVTKEPPREASATSASGATGVITLPHGVVCDRTRNQVVVTGEVAVDSGFLEQIACTSGTREHEALVVVNARPSDVHAALLLLGAQPGRPGRWEYGETEVHRRPPEGARLRVRVRFVDQSGALQEHPISSWVVGQPGDRPFPEQPWVFGGSVIDEQGSYRADSSGSLIGLVTFGDEVLGLESVVADSVEVDSAVWEAQTLLVPRPGTPVQLVLSAWTTPAKP